MSIARTISLLVASAVYGCLAISPVSAQTVAANSPQQASLSVNPSSQDYVAVPAVSHAVPPKDPVALAAFHVLETHCARCHETDRLVGRAKPAKGFGNILHMDEVAANTKYVKPGDPVHSTLYWTVFRKEMPSDMNNGDMDLATFPNDADMKALRDWIVTLDKPQQPAMVVSLTLPTSDWQGSVNALDSRRAEKPVTVPPLDIGAAEAPAPQASVKTASLVHDDEAVSFAPKAVDPGPNLNGPVSADLVWKTQDRLKAIGCYEGQVNGIEDPQTDAALARYNAKLGRGTAVAAVSSDLLEELMSQVGRICTQFCPPGTTADGLQCVPNPDTGPIERRRAPSTDIGRTDEDAPRQHKRRFSAPPADVAHAPESHRPHQAERTPEPRHPRQVERTPEPRRPRQVERTPEPRRPRQVERAPEPQRRTAHSGDTHLRQPSYRQSQSRSAPQAREASRGSSSSSGGVSGGGGGGGGGSTVSGMSGI